MKQQLAVLHLQEEVLRAESDLQGRMEGKSITSSLNRRAAPSLRGLSCNLTAVFLFVLDGKREGASFPLLSSANPLIMSYLRPVK